MSDDTNNKKESDPPKSIWQELRDAGLPRIARLAFVAIASYLVLLLGAICIFGVEKAGQFGDAFGVLTSMFNALAFAAVVATVVLQSRELRESRHQLTEQAKAQKAWADAANNQIALTRTLEFAKSRPFITAGWDSLAIDFHTRSFSIRNVGLGVAILHAIELRLDGKFVILFTSSSLDDAKRAWHDTFKQACDGEADPAIHAWEGHFDDHSRVLSPGDAKALVTITIGGQIDEVNRIAESIKNRIQIVVHFESVYREKLSTDTQFNYLHLDTDAGSA